MKKMTSFLTIFIILSLSLNAASLRFAKKMGYEIDYQNAIAKARQANKPVMMIIGTKTCPWCRKFESQTLRKEMVNHIVSNKFIPLSLTRDVDNYPFHFEAKVVPMVFFINPNTEKAYFTSKGYKNKRKYKETLNVALKNYTGNVE
jgi:thioredoxin-related protein